MECKGFGEFKETHFHEGRSSKFKADVIMLQETKRTSLIERDWLPFGVQGAKIIFSFQPKEQLVAC